MLITYEMNRPKKKKNLKKKDYSFMNLVIIS